MFPFLIGRIRTIKGRYYPLLGKDGFPFLIGRIRTKIQSFLFLFYPGFHSS